MTDEPILRSTIRHVKRFQGGEESAWDRLTVKISEETKRCVRPKNLPPSFELEDLAQMVNVSAFQSIKTFEGIDPDSFRKWIRSILKNRITDLWRRQRTKKRGAADAAIDFGALEDESGGIDDQLADAGARTPLVELEAKEAEARMREAEANLKDQHRTVLNLREHEGLSYAEIAEQMELVNADAARFLNHYARRRRADGMRSYFESNELGAEE